MKHMYIMYILNHTEYTGNRLSYVIYDYIGINL